MVTLRKKRKLAALAKETQERHPRNGQSRNTRNISHKFLKRLKAESLENSQEFSRTESSIFDALSNLEEFLLNPQAHTNSGIVPGTSRNTNVENQESSEDRSQDDPHPEVGPSVYQSRHSNDSDPDEAPHNCL